MSDDLHTRLHTAITTRLELAKAAEMTDQNSSWYSVDELADGHDKGGAGLNGIDAAFIAANDPAFVVRACERDLRVIDRHPPHRLVELGTVPPDPDPPRCWCCHMIYPCSEITDLATVYLETP